MPRQRNPVGRFRPADELRQQAFRFRHRDLHGTFKPGKLGVLGSNPAAPTIVFKRS